MFTNLSNICQLNCTYSIMYFVVTILFSVLDFQEQDETADVATDCVYSKLTVTCIHTVEHR